MYFRFNPSRKSWIESPIPALFLFLLFPLAHLLHLAEHLFPKRTVGRHAGVLLALTVLAWILSLVGTNLKGDQTVQYSVVGKEQVAVDH